MVSRFTDKIKAGPRSAVDRAPGSQVGGPGSILGLAISPSADSRGAVVSYTVLAKVCARSTG